MPILKSAKKALRQDRRRTLVNKPIKSRAQNALAAARKNPGVKTLSQAFSALDKAVKRRVIKKGKADRLKQRLARLLAKVTKAPANKTQTAKTRKSAAKTKQRRVSKTRA